MSIHTKLEAFCFIVKRWYGLSRIELFKFTKIFKSIAYDVFLSQTNENYAGLLLLAVSKGHRIYRQNCAGFFRQNNRIIFKILTFFIVNKLEQISKKHCSLFNFPLSKFLWLYLLYYPKSKKNLRHFNTSCFKLF